MADSISDADKIRNKRLAKLQAMQDAQKAQESSSAEAAAAAAQSEEKVPATDGTSSPAESARKIVSPVSAKVEPTTTAPAPRIRITPQITPAKRESNGIQRSSSRQGQQAKPDEPIEQWTDRILRGIFRLTFDAGNTKDQNGHELHPVPGLKEELESEGKLALLSTESLETAIMEAGSNLGRLRPHKWLFACWKRVLRFGKSMKDKTPENMKWQVLLETRRLCFSYCMLTITTPELFSLEYNGSQAFADHMLQDPEDDAGVCHEFLTEAVSKWDEDDTIGTAFVGAVEELSRRLAGITMDGDYRPYLGMMRRLVAFKQITIAITQAPSFCDKSIPAAELETKTILGPFFQLSPLQAEVCSQFFPGPKSLDQGRIRNAQNSLQMSLRTHQLELDDVIGPMVKASPEARGKVLDWFALVVNSNHKRTAIQVDRKLVSSDGFMINIADETKINATQEESDKFYAESATGTNNFISEVFFLTTAAHQYGLESTRKSLKTLDRELKHMSQQLEVFEQDRHKYIANPAQLQMYERALKKYKDQQEKGMSYKMAVEGVLNDELAQTRSMQFMRFVTVWLLRQMSSGTFPQKPLTLPLPPEKDAIR
ncbi:Ubiquitin conjugation factor E4, partial [Elasticomyces elasticus]